jgi:hypothetical protein
MPIAMAVRGIRLWAIILAFLFGLLGLVVMFVAGSWSGSGDYAVIAGCSLFLFGNAWLSKRFPSGNLFYGLLMNAPAWLFFILLADSGQFRGAVIGLVVCLVAAYVGMFLGIKLSPMGSRATKWTLTICIPAVIIALVALYTFVKGPTPIPDDKQEFVGQWRTSSGFELQIRADGTASIVNNQAGAPNLNIREGPDRIEGANARFAGDSILNVGVPGLYARTYRIDQYPQPDSMTYAMVLNGALLRWQR